MLKFYLIWSNTKLCPVGCSGEAEVIWQGKEP
ncbi:hypothetical protein PM8797T_16640 [Gimesia maris DSM 8797]|nr:hypothetical protein PM8797T_16640 [Gimesia maris DSM 8797]